MGALTEAQVIVDHDIIPERWRQLKKWGTQNHPDGTVDDHFTRYVSDKYRAMCEQAFKESRGTWKDILLEEVYEAMAESDPAALRTELIQVAAVCVAWVEDIDRRAK